MWEYDVRSLWYFEDGEYISERNLNELGEEGWELVQIHNEQIIFKRKIKEEE